MSQPDILKLTREALEQCSEGALDKVDAVADAVGGLFEALIPGKSLKAKMITGVLKQCVKDERAKRTEGPAPDPDTGPSPKT